VAQGDAKHSPLALDARQGDEADPGEGSGRSPRRTSLEDEKARLEEMRDTLQKEIEGLEARKAQLESTVSQLEMEKTRAQESAHHGRQAAEHQNLGLVRRRSGGSLRARGVLKTVNKVENIGEVKFANNIDLTKTKSDHLKPASSASITSRTCAAFRLPQRRTRHRRAASATTAPSK